MHGLSTAQDGTHHRLEEKLRQVEGELQHIERAILAGLVGETTASLLKAREARRTALRQQLRGTAASACEGAASGYAEYDSHAAGRSVWTAQRRLGSGECVFP